MLAHITCTRRRTRTESKLIKAKLTKVTFESSKIVHMSVKKKGEQGVSNKAGHFLRILRSKYIICGLVQIFHSIIFMKIKKSHFRLFIIFDQTPFIIFLNTVFFREQKYLKEMEGTSDIY